MREAYLTGGNDHFDATDASEPFAGTAAPEVSKLANPSEINLTKIKLDGGALYVEYTTGEADGQAECTVRHKRPVHADLLAAFAALTPHLCLMCELVTGVVMEEGEYVPASMLYHQLVPADAPPLHERKEFSSYHVTGVTFSNTGAVLVGQKRYRSGKKVLNLVTPHEVLHPEQELGDEYEHLRELNYELDTLEHEAHLYLLGKHGAAVVQAELFGENADQPAANKFATAMHELGDKMASKGYTVSVGRPGEELHELGKGKKKAGKDAAAGSDT